MSLFKTEQFWTASSGQGESYTSSSLCVANFLSNNSSDNNNTFDQIVTGSLNGYLRLFCPQRDLDKDQLDHRDSDDNPFSLSHSNERSSIDSVSLELNLSQPVLQVDAGRFSNSDSSQLSLAVLTPNRLAIFEIDQQQSDKLMSFKPIEEFNLKRVGFNFCFGDFGRVSADRRDFICVQSTDTTLSFFVNGHLSFSCFVADYLLPGPIQYLPVDDSILIVNSNRFLESYKYKNLAVVNANNNNSNSPSSKTASPDWRFNLGEDALQISVQESSADNNPCTILILSRFSIFIFDYQTRTALKKRFECRLKRAVCYNSIGPRFVTINGLNELSVFENTALKWKAAIDNVPDVCDLNIGRFNAINGFIVVLSESGRLSVVFLGTDPTVVVVSSPANRESLATIQSDRNEDELSILKQKIRSITAQNSQPKIALSNSLSAMNKANKSPLKISIDYSSAKLSSDSSEYSIDIRLKSVSEDLTNILTRIAVEKPIECRRNFFSNHSSSISPGKDAVISLKFIRTAAMVVSSLKAAIFVSFDSSNSIESHCRITQTSLTLPIALVLSVCPPEKNAKFKLTIDTPDHPVVDLSQLFSDLSSSSSISSDEKFAPVAIGFRYHNDGPIVTILASGASKRYRIQSDHFEAIWLVLHELTNRLNRSIQNLSIRYSDPLPIDSYFLVLDCHFAIRSNLRQLEQLLNDRSRQYRAIQKLFLTKIKDQSIAPSQSSTGGNNLDNLESLLENSISQLTQLADMLLEQQNHLAIVSNALCAATNTIGYLIGVSTVTNIAAPLQRDLLLHALSHHHCRDYAELGLEELYEQIFSFLLKQFSSSSTNRSSRIDKKLAESKFELPNNIDRLKKHIRLFCEIISTGSTSGALQSSVISESINEDNNIDDDESDLKRFVTSPRSNKPKKSKRTKKLMME